jgi:hypothetical protein
MRETIRWKYMYVRERLSTNNDTTRGWNYHVLDANSAHATFQHMIVRHKTLVAFRFKWPPLLNGQFVPVTLKAVFPEALMLVEVGMDSLPICSPFFSAPLI